MKDSKQEGPLPFIPGRLKSNFNIWWRTTSDPFVLSVIQHGYRIQWKDSTPPPQSEQNNSKNCLNHNDFITKSIQEVLLLVVVQETSKEYLHNVSPLNVIGKYLKIHRGPTGLIFLKHFITLKSTQIMENIWNFSGTENITHSCAYLSSQPLGHVYGIGSYAQS